jgi:hypothetical protein
MPRAPRLAACAAASLPIVAFLAFAALSAAPVATGIAQIPGETGKSQSPSGLAASCEVFCSQTKPGVSNARIRWSLTGAALADAKLKALSAAPQNLDVTVFYNGLDKGLYVTLPISGKFPQRAVAAQLPPKQASLRAYQIQIVEGGPPKDAPPGQAAERALTEHNVVVEGLEPGVNYTWRVTVGSPAGKLTSEPVTCQAPTCPVDASPARREPRRIR